jgi:arylsulfatase A-like enzyme
MKRIALLVLFGVWLGASACSRTVDNPKRPNVVVISVDTLRSDSLRAYNSSATPRPVMDGLAERGHVFVHAYSTAPWTLPSHVSLFTGLYPSHHGVVDGKHAMTDVSSFVQTLRANGYQTIGFGDGGYVSADFGFPRGFEVYDAWRDDKSASAPISLPRGGKRNFDTTQHVFDRASAFLRERSSDRPLFLFAHTYAVHDYFRSWLPKEPGKAAAATPESKKRLQCLLGLTPCSPQKWRELESMYEAGIDAFDRDLGSFLELVERTLGSNDTFIILLSDHGEGFDHARNRIHHGGRLHRDQLQVPLLVAGPGIESGRSEELVSLVDIRPSLLELVAVTDDAKHDGRSFVAQLHDGRSLFARLVSFFAQPAAKPPEESRDAIMASEHRYYWQSGQRRTVSKPSEEPTTSARIDARFWYIKDLDGEQLYRLSDKQQEKSLVEELNMRRYPNRSSTPRASQRSQVEPSAELIEQLRALGYVE